MHLRHLLCIFLLFFFRFGLIITAGHHCLLKQFLSQIEVLLTGGGLSDSDSKSGKFFVSCNHLLSVFTKQSLLNSQEFGPHKESILVATERLKVASINGDNFLQEGMVFVSLTVCNLLFKSLAQLHFNSDGSCLGPRIHHHNGVKQNSFVQKLVGTDRFPFMNN